MRSKILKIYNIQFLKYGIVGVISVVIDYFLLYLSYSHFGLSSSVSISIGFWGSTILNFLMHRFYTFSETTNSNHFIVIIKYILLIIGSYFITLIMIEKLLEYGLNIYFAKLISLLIVYVYGYIIGKKIVFI
ncbi:conserved hypothetical protein [Sulfurovum sp. NBC37-1]|nr:conserved hypothetical protein [Sulfurovum sp. NBC37-1]